MSFKQDHPVWFYIFSILVVCVAVVSIIWTIGNYSVQATKINAEKEIKRTEIEQIEETKRAEESAQFWQKVIPWGEYEEDKE